MKYFMQISPRNGSTRAHANKSLIRVLIFNYFRDKINEMQICMIIIVTLMTCFPLFQNSPLYVLTSNIDKEIELQYRIHSALDIIDEKCNATTSKNPDLRDLYLGLLYATESYKM